MHILRKKPQISYPETWGVEKREEVSIKKEMLNIWVK